MMQRGRIGLVLCCAWAGAALAQSSFTTTKTVGTAPGVCAPTAAITLPPGPANVTYCYVITNGSGTNASYSLSDDKLGLLVANASLPLGATSQILVNAVVNGSTTNVANWTVPGFSSMVASAQVSNGVDVPTLTDLGLVALGMALAATGVVAIRARTI